MIKEINKFYFFAKKVKTYIVPAVLAAILAGFLFFLKAEIGKAQDLVKEPENFSQLSIVQENSLLAVSDPAEPKGIEVAQKFNVIVTGYSSTVWETWGDPFITADGGWVEDGVIANNLLPFGTKVRLPELYGNKIFVVKDRMHSRKASNHMDIWFSSNQLALNFGVKNTYVEVVEETIEEI
ncbi:MAG: hypothetical protein ABH919_00875 [bacterium]